jgi:hypothetical protein
LKIGYENIPSGSPGFVSRAGLLSQDRSADLTNCLLKTPKKERVKNWDRLCYQNWQTLEAKINTSRFIFINEREIIGIDAVVGALSQLKAGTQISTL